MPALIPALSDLVNNEIAQVIPSPIRVVDSKFNEIEGIIKLTLGEPDFAVPTHIKEATKQAIDNDDSHYANSWGHLSLREAVSEYLTSRFNTANYNPTDEVIITVGASEAIYATFNALFNRGDKIIIPTPTFPMYNAIAQSIGLDVININTAPDFVLTPTKLENALKANPDIKAILFNYPSNPTGVTYSDTEVKDIANLIKQHKLLAISDEIYAELVYDAPHTSLASLLPEQTVLISGLSKSHAMTGYRIGYIAAPAALAKHIGKMHQFLVTTAPGPMMDAAEEALRYGVQDAKDMCAVYKERRDLVLNGLTQAGFTAAQPGGAFYIFAKIPTKLNTNDVPFVYDLAEKAKIGVAPGSIFGAGGEGYIRLSYAASTEILSEALHRLQDYSTKYANS